VGYLYRCTPNELILSIRLLSKVNVNSGCLKILFCKTI